MWLDTEILQSLDLVKLGLYFKEQIWLTAHSTDSIEKKGRLIIFFIFK